MDFQPQFNKNPPNYLEGMDIDSDAMLLKVDTAGGPIDDTSLLYYKRRLFAVADELCKATCSIDAAELKDGMTLNPAILNSIVSSALFGDVELESLKTIARQQSQLWSPDEGELDPPLLLPPRIVDLYGKLLVEIANAMVAVCASRSELNYPIMLSKNVPKDVGSAFEKAPTLQAILLAIDGLDCRIRAREKPSYDLKGLRMSLEISLIHLRSALQYIKLGLNESLRVSVATITRIIRGEMTLSVGVLLCYTVSSFLLALLVTKFFTIGRQDALEYLKWSYNDVNVA